jgi:hypothetical protein
LTLIQRDEEKSLNRSTQSPRRKENVAEFYAAGTPHKIPQRFFCESDPASPQAVLLDFSLLPILHGSCDAFFMAGVRARYKKRVTFTLRDLRVLLFKFPSSLHQCKSVKISGEVFSS